MTLSLFDVVTLLQDLPKEGLYAGMLGTVVDVHTTPILAYEVEFCDGLGRTIAQLALHSEQLKQNVTGFPPKKQYGVTFHEHRATYSTIKQWVLEAYFDFCRDRGLVLGRPHAEILGGVTYEYEGCFERPIERLMLEVVCMVLNGGWYQHSMNHHREQIQKIIAVSSLENLLVDASQEEEALFRHDLKILKLI